jgi:acyl-CoA reductase-like NAD-dependent aldehyde dehydrogenase
MRTISHFINGQSVMRAGAVTSPVYDPGTGEVQARLEHGDAAILAEAVAVAKAAQPTWAAMNPLCRVRVLFKFKSLLEERMQEQVHLMSSEHGKLLDDSMGELERGLEVVEFICGAPHLQKGEFTQGAGPGTNVYSIREPLGVVAGITPFNFPALIPIWMLAPSIAVGNAFILKPPDRTPSAAVRLAELALEAGVPPGIFNIAWAVRRTTASSDRRLYPDGCRRGRRTGHRRAGPALAGPRGGVFPVADPDRSRHAFYEELPGRDLRPRAADRSCGDVRGGAELPDRPPPRQRGFGVHA